MNFTAVPNNLFPLFRALDEPELKLVLCVIRFSYGWQREWAECGETLLVAESGLSRSALYRTRGKLVERGVLEIDRSGPTCAYRVVAPGGPTCGTGSHEWDGVPPVGRGATRGTGSRKWDVGPTGGTGGGPTDGTLGGPTRGTGSILNKDLKKDLNKASSSTAPLGGDDDPLKNEIVSLSLRLQSLGISKREARKFASELEPGVIERSLRNLPLRQGVTSPAAFLATELRAGGYPDPAPSPEQAAQIQAEARREAVSQRRKQDEAQAQRERAKTAGELERLLERLNDVQRTALVDQARFRLRAISPVAAAGPADSAPMRAAMLEILRARASPESAAG